jgi:hypothetical protein
MPNISVQMRNNVQVHEQKKRVLVRNDSLPQQYKGIDGRDRALLLFPLLVLVPGIAR